MKTLNNISRLLLMLPIAAAFSCSSSAPKLATDSTTVKTEETTSTTVAVPPKAEWCFINAKNRDTTAIHLEIKEDKVTGHMNWLPYEKDARIGTISGTKSGDVLTLTWSFMQEGMTDTIKIEFLLTGKTLKQKPLVFNSKTGRQQTDLKSDYTVTFDEADCSTINFKR